MKDPYDEGVANHIGPESCVGRPRGGSEALTGGEMGRVKSREMGSSWVPTQWDERKATPAAPLGEEQSDPARSKTPSTPRSFLARESGDPQFDRPDDGWRSAS